MYMYCYVKAVVCSYIAIAILIQKFIMHAITAKKHENMGST